MLNTKILSIIAIGFTLFVLLPVKSGLAQDDVAPPAENETLIYVLREGRLTGAAVKFWIAVNDQTVARVKNKDYAVVRAKAGLVTVNVAAQGGIGGQIALDDRPGQTVYVKFRLGDLELNEISAKEAHEFLRKADRTDPIDEVRGNNEEIAVLINLSRLGFDVMKPADGEIAPDEEYAVLTIFRRKEGEKFEFGVWGQQGFIGTLGANEGVSVRVPAGEHFFIAGNTGKTLLKLDAKAGNRYYAWLDFGKMIGRVRLTPVAAGDADKLDDWLADVHMVQVDPGTITSRIKEREQKVVHFINLAAERTVTGESDFHLLSDDHAFQ